MKNEIFTWENFRNDAIAVRCRTEWEAKQFLACCRKNGFTWDSGAKINPEKQTYHSVNGPLTCYIARADFPRIGYRSLEWACEHGYTVILSDEAIASLCDDAGRVHGYVEKLEKTADNGVHVSCTFVGGFLDESAERERCGCKDVGVSGTPTPSRWRDAVSDKPMRDGEHVILVRWIADGMFHTGLYITMFDVSSGKWGFIDNNEYVITHWLDGVPELPEVVVR